MILSLDPSSTCIGYARFGGFDGGTMLNAGRMVTPQKPSAYVRMVKLADDIVDLIREYNGPRMIVIVEVPSGRVNHGRHKGSGAGLSIYGVAVGYLLGRLANLDVDVRMILENEWTRGIPKDKRRESVAARHGSYRAIQDKDPGGDISDAIALGEWWIMEQKLLPAAADAGGER